jgi:lipopolysaccharide transport system permease protein
MTVFGHLRELAPYSHLILSFARRDIRARYKQTAIGLTWAVLQPVSLMLVFAIVFGHVARIPSEGIPYPLFSYTRLIFWMFFVSTISQGTTTMVANASLVRKIYFPRETLLLGVFLSSGLDFLVAAGLLLGMLLYYGVALSWTVVWVLPLLGIQLLFTFGLICLTSAINVHFRDVGHGIPLALQLWMFATPVAYPLSVVPSWLLPFYRLNPMAFIIDGYHRAILGREGPDLASLGVGLGVAVILVSGAYLFFKSAERTFADVI